MSRPAGRRARPAPVHLDPLRAAGRWIARATRAGVPEPHAAALATVGLDGSPAVRMVLARVLRGRGLVFYTNYRSRKGREIEAEPRCALVFWWPALARQLRVEGRAAPLSREESDRYFDARPRGARLAAIASPQSRAIRDRSALLRRFARLARRYRGRAIPRPRHWGGYWLEPTAIEFWRGRAHRLHDRLRYERRARGGWRRLRLAP